MHDALSREGRNGKAAIVWDADRPCLSVYLYSNGSVGHFIIPSPPGHSVIHCPVVAITHASSSPRSLPSVPLGTSFPSYKSLAFRQLFTFFLSLLLLLLLLFFFFFLFPLFPFPFCHFVSRPLPTTLSHIHPHKPKKKTLPHNTHPHPSQAFCRSRTSQVPSRSKPVSYFQARPTFQAKCRKPFSPRSSPASPISRQPSSCSPTR